MLLHVRRRYSESLVEIVAAKPADQYWNYNRTSKFTTETLENANKILHFCVLPSGQFAACFSQLHDCYTEMFTLNGSSCAQYGEIIKIDIYLL